MKIRHKDGTVTTVDTKEDPGVQFKTVDAHVEVEPGEWVWVKFPGGEMVLLQDLINGPSQLTVWTDPDGLPCLDYQVS